MTYLSDLEFPRRIAMGAQRRPTWNTELQRNAGGFATTISGWADALHEFDVSFAVRTAGDYATILDHFHSARGRAHTFPFRDMLDYKVTAARGILVDADGDSPTTAFQLVKTYGSGAAMWRRRISRPESGTVVIYRLRAGITTDITGSATISYTTGQVTFSGGAYLPGSGDVLSWTGQFWVPCRYAEDSLPAAVVDKRAGSRSGLDGLLVTCDSIKLEEDREA